MSAKRTKSTGKHRARYDDDDELTDFRAAERVQELEGYVDSLSALEAPSDAIFTHGKKRELAVAVWSNRSSLDGGELLDSNPSLTDLLRRLTENTKHKTASGSEIEFMLTNLTRCKSQKCLPLLTARLSLEALRTKVNHDFWQVIHTLAPGLLFSHTWAKEFADYALKFQPMPDLTKCVDGVGAAVFDNYQRRMLYKSQVTTESSGYLYKMTNWGQMSIPRHLVDPNFDASQLCMCALVLNRCTARGEPRLALAARTHTDLSHRVAVKTPFVPISMARFTSLFAETNPEIVAGKSARFTKFLRSAVTGDLFARPQVRPTWKARFTWMPHMPGIDQLSYDDVEAELNVMRNAQLSKFLLLVGGDGLSIHRIWWLLAKYPELYVDSAPLIIPVQGEAPHGVFHMMHGGWRLYWRFIEWCAQQLNRNERAIKSDPHVSDFNSHFFFLQILTRACAEVVAELQRSGPGVDHPEAILDEAERNAPCAWICHFLHDFAFMVHEFKQGVRASDATALDRIWREFYATGHTSTANKNLYVPMAIMKIWQAEAIAPPIKRLLDNTRSIPLSDREGAMTGWDMPCERLNAYITNTVQTQVSPESIDRAVKLYPLLEHNRSLLASTSREHMMKDIEQDVQVLKEALFQVLDPQNLGNTWHQATVARATTPWTANQNQRGRAPWHEVRECMRGGVATHIATQVRKLTDSYYAFLP